VTVGKRMVRGFDRLGAAGVVPVEQIEERFSLCFT
jgi:hypothetical protein